MLYGPVALRKVPLPRFIGLLFSKEAAIALWFKAGRQHSAAVVMLAVMFNRFFRLQIFVLV